MFYFVKTPGWLKKLYGNCIWQGASDEKIIYLTFDDGPHPVATKFVLDTLQRYQASATFFCIGKNVAEQPALFERILREGHAVGNHTFNHLNGWKTTRDEYLDNIAAAKKLIPSFLFRPPYGRITRSQLRQLPGELFRLHTIMWTVLSGDFDINLSPERCLQNVVKNCEKGSIVVFHDSKKALERLVFALPAVLDHFTSEGYRFEKITI